MSLDVAVLGFLSERPRTGYEIKNRCFAGPISTFWTADQAQIYRTLEHLRHEGLVSVTRRRQTGRPDRRLFDITPAGRSTLHRMLADPGHIPPNRDPSLVQIYFAADLDNATLLELLRSLREEHQARLENLRVHAAAAAQDPPTSQRVELLRQTALDGAMSRERSLIDWLDDCIEAVRGGELPEEGDSVGQRRFLGS